jgi:tRNA nucleotidyltransferase (CCA-adding enzyme)
MISVTLPQPVLFVLARLQAEGYDAYIVGGAVRDLVMKRPISDWDFTTNATPEEIQKVFPLSFYDNVYGTVGVATSQVVEMMAKNQWQAEINFLIEPNWKDQVLEITTYRSESGYSDRRRPDKVDWGDNLEADLSRRDFTMNSLALKIQPTVIQGLAAFMTRKGELEIEVDVIDPYQGLKDIAARLVKAVGEAKRRFEEDALRMMRAIRFGAQLGFLIEMETLNAIQTSAHLIKAVSAERVREELLKILASDYPADGMTLLDNSGLLQYLIQEMLLMKGVKQGGHHIYDVWTHSLESLRNCPSTDPIVRLAALLHDIGKPVTVRYEGIRGVTFYGHEVVGSRIARDIGRRLRLSNKEIDRLFILVRWHMFTYNPEMTDAAIRRFIKNVGLDNINDMILLRVGDRKGGGSKATSWRLNELQKRIGEQLYEPLSLKDLKINGIQVMESLELKPGPIIGKILNQLFDEVMENTSKNEISWLEGRAKELLALFIKDSVPGNN